MPISHRTAAASAPCGGCVPATARLRRAGSGRAGCVVCAGGAPAGASPSLPSRRVTLSLPFIAAAAAAAAERAAATPLAPLGRVGTRQGGDKLTGLPIEEVRDILARDLAERQYFVSGNLTSEVFADDARFTDPTNDVVGLARYTRALDLLFDPAHSAVRLKGIRVTGPSTIEADYVMGGYLKFPWNPRVAPFEGHIVYSLDKRGLVARQEQSWSISGTTALLESFTPTSGVSDDVREAVLRGYVASLAAARG